MSKIAFIYPGQGAQHMGMGKEFFDAFESVRARFEECSGLLGYDMAELCFMENDRLDDTRYTQPAMVLVELALTEVLMREKGIRAELSAGLSLGEYAAISEAGIFSFQDAVKTVALRGRLMAEAVPAGEGAMAAVLGADVSLIQEVLEQIEGAYIANYNCPGQIVITGHKKAVETACGKLQEAGARKCVLLNVSGPFHSPLLAGAGKELGEALTEVALGEAVHPYVANVTAETVSDTAKVKELLEQQVSSSVRWQQSVENMLQAGIDTFVEIGPGKTLAGFMKKILKEYAGKTGADVSGIRTFTVNTPEDMEKLCGIE